MQDSSQDFLNLLLIYLDSLGVYTYLTDDSGQIIKDINGNNLEAYSEFDVESRILT